MPVKEIINIEISFSNASLEQRERIQQQNQSIRTNLKENGFDFFILSTCNRYSVFIEGNQVNKAILLFSQLGLNLTQFEITTGIIPCLNKFMKISSGLESMILGETEISNQVKHQSNNAISNKETGPILNLMINAALKCSKRIKNETFLNANTTSIASTGLKNALGILPNPQNILLIGTGKVSESILPILLKQQNNTITIASHQGGRALDIALKNDIQWTTIDEIPNIINKFDLIIGCTHVETPMSIFSSPCPRHEITIDYDKERVLLDLGSPSNFNKNIKLNRNIHLIDIDDIQEIIQKNISTRNQAIPEAEKIIKEEIEIFNFNFSRSIKSNVSKNYWNSLNQAKNESLDWLFPKLGELPSEQRELIERFAHQLIRKVSKPTFEHINKLNKSGKTNDTKVIENFLPNPIKKP